MEGFGYDQVLLKSGTFSADEVFTVALCRLLNPKIKIIRATNFEKHLTRASRIKETVLPLEPECTTYFPMLWSKHGQLLCDNVRAWREIRIDFANKISIEPLANDMPNFLSYSIEALNIRPDKRESEDICFHRAMNIAMILLSAQIKLANSKIINLEEDKNK